MELGALTPLTDAMVLPFEPVPIIEIPGYVDKNGINMPVVGDLVAIGITTMAETPGVGTKVRDEAFLAQFHGMSKDTVFQVEKDGGEKE
mgnify:CR=1 FL=1